MGQEHSTALKKAFETLDTDHNGQLNLRDILTIQDVGGVEHLVHNGPLLLYRFDKSGEGSINYSEFTKLLTYVKSKEKELRAKGIGLMRKKVWCPIDRQTMNLSYELSRDASTPMITGQRPEDEPPTEEDLEEVEGTVLAEEISRDAGEFFDQTVASIDGRKKFLLWLFKMTDTNNDERLSTEELLVLIRALRHDGINPEELTYDPERLLKDAAKAGNGSEDSQDRYFATQLLHEYDVEHRGYLSPSEFQVLASLIVKNYELRNEYQDSEHQIRLKGFRLARRLGKGANGEVRLAVELKTGIRMAVKIVPKRDMAHLSSLDTEITAMMLLQHPHIVKLDQVQEDDQNVFFVMELCGGGNISDYLDGKPISEMLARFYFQQIVEGVEYCHENGVAHRDLKLDNILLDNNANIKITDFGHAGIYKSGWDVFQTPLVGGLCHLAPEQILGHSYSGEKHDVWSLGVILYVLLSGHSPFTSNHPQQLLEDIKNVRYVMPKDISPEAKDLISLMLVAESGDRPSIAQISVHPWLTKGNVDAPLLTSFTLPVPSGFWKRFTCTSESMCHLLKLLDIEPVYNSSTIQNIADEHMDVRCHWPAKDVRFSFKVKGERSDGTQLLEFRLSSGASREFLSLMTRLKSTIAQRIRRNRKLEQREVAANLLLKSSSASVTGTRAHSTGHMASKSHSGPKEDRISDELPAESIDTSLRPQIVSLAELQQLEAAAAAQAREADSKVHAVDAEHGKKKRLKDAGFIPRDHSMPRERTTTKSEFGPTAVSGPSIKESGHHKKVKESGTFSKEVSPDSSESESESLTTSAPVPHRPHHSSTRSKNNNTLTSALLPANQPLLGSSHNAAAGEEIRRSRSVPHGTAPGEESERSSSQTAMTATTASHHSSKPHSGEKTGYHHLSGSTASSATTKKHRSAEDEEPSLGASGASIGGSKTGSKTGESSHIDKSGHHHKPSKQAHPNGKELDTSESGTTYKKHSKKPSDVPVSILTSSTYIPGQILSQIAGLIAHGNVASEPYVPKRRKSKSSSRNGGLTESKTIARKSSKKSKSGRRNADLEPERPASQPIHPTRSASRDFHGHNHLRSHHRRSSSSSSGYSSLSDSESSTSSDRSRSSSSDSSDESTRSRHSRSSRRSRDRAGSPSSRASSRARNGRKSRASSPHHAHHQHQQLSYSAVAAAAAARDKEHSYAKDTSKSSRNPSPVRSSTKHGNGMESAASSRASSPVRGRKASPDRSSKSKRKSASRSRSRSRQPSPMRHAKAEGTPRESTPSSNLPQLLHTVSTPGLIEPHPSTSSTHIGHHQAPRTSSSSRNLSTVKEQKEKEHRSEHKDNKEHHHHHKEHKEHQKDHHHKEHKEGRDLKASASQLPPVPTTTPTKVTKSFRRVKDSKLPKGSKNATHSLPVSPKSGSRPRRSSGSSSSSHSSASRSDSSSSSSRSSRSLSLSASSTSSISSTEEASDDEFDVMRRSGHGLNGLQVASARDAAAGLDTSEGGTSTPKSSAPTSRSEPAAVKGVKSSKEHHRASSSAAASFPALASSPPAQPKDPKRHKPLKRSISSSSTSSLESSAHLLDTSSGHTPRLPFNDSFTSFHDSEGDESFRSPRIKSRPSEHSLTKTTSSGSIGAASAVSSVGMANSGSVPPPPSSSQVPHTTPAAVADNTTIITHVHRRHSEKRHTVSEKTESSEKPDKAFHKGADHHSHKEPHESKSSSHRESTSGRNSLASSSAQIDENSPKKSAEKSAAEKPPSPSLGEKEKHVPKSTPSYTPQNDGTTSTSINNSTQSASHLPTTSASAATSPIRKRSSKHRSSRSAHHSPEESSSEDEKKSSLLASPDMTQKKHSQRKHQPPSTAASKA